MKVKIVFVGKTEKSYLKEGIEEYLKRLNFYAPFEMVIIPELKNAKNLSRELIKEKEGEQILGNLKSVDTVVLMDEKGKVFTSVEFSNFLQSQMNSGIKTLVFIIGGAYGFAKQVYDRANHLISLSKMTFSHQMVRLFLVEQIYRGFTIIKNEPYHHE